MNKLRSFVLAATLLTVCYQTVFCAEPPVAIEPRDTLVMVIVRTFIGRGAGNGFVIGDGTLVVTAHHVVYGKSEQGRHMDAGLVSVVSPYIGDGCEAKIVAADEELDLAILKIPWAGHPALKLADQTDLLSAERLVVTGIPEIIRSMGSDTQEPIQESLNGQSESLAVDYVAVRQQVPRFILLGETGQLRPGWSGSPMLLPNSTVVAGCFAALRTAKGGERVGAAGPAVTQVRHLLWQSGDEKSLKPGNSTLPRAKDGIDAFLSFARAYRHYLRDQHGRASDRIKEFLSLRGESSFAYILSASNADKQMDFELADQHYRKAIALNPEAVELGFYYAQSLVSRNPDKALEMFQGMWHVDELKPFVATLMFNVFIERNQFERAGELMNEALKLSPRNAHLWMGLGGCRYKMDKFDAAIADYIKGVELLPERGPFRGRLAHLLEQVGRLDEAEKHFRELLKIEPDNPVVHLWLARFLAKHRPQAKDEALKEAQIALELPRRRGLSRDEIRQVIQELQSETEPAP